jgi:hypothetical protein
MKPRKIRSITIIGRRWFRKSAGNSYCSATVLINGVVVCRVAKTSGYGNYYEQISWEKLESIGFCTDRCKNIQNGSSEPPWTYCQRKKIDYHREALDVAREKDL